MSYDTIVTLINDSGCVCGWVIEDAIHFFLECCLYVEAREQLTNNLQFLDSLLIETLLFGDDSLSEGKMHKYSNQCNCTSNKRNVLPHSDHTNTLEKSESHPLLPIHRHNLGH
jgi:hypothetical protein